MGLQADVLEARPGCASRTGNTWALWRAKRCYRRIQCAIWRRRRPDSSPTQAVQPDQGSQIPTSQSCMNLSALAHRKNHVSSGKAAYRHFPADRCVSSMREEIQGTGWRSQNSTAGWRDFLIHDGRIEGVTLTKAVRVAQRYGGACPGATARRDTFQYPAPACRL